MLRIKGATTSCGFPSLLSAGSVFTDILGKKLNLQLFDPKHVYYRDTGHFQPRVPPNRPVVGLFSHLSAPKTSLLPWPTTLV